MKNVHGEKRIARGSNNGQSDSWDRDRAIETNHLCFVARGRGLVRVGDSTKAARLALAQEIAFRMDVQPEILTDEPIQEIIGWMPIFSVGYVFIGDEEKAKAA